MTRPKQNAKGAGRPKGRNSVTKSVGLPESVWAELDAKRGKVSRGAFLARVWMEWNKMNDLAVTRGANEPPSPAKEQP